MTNSVIERDLDEIIENDVVPWEQLSGRTILVSGAGGMLASYVVRAALHLNTKQRLEQPVRVLGLIRSMDSAKRNLGSAVDDPQLKLVVGDVRQAVVIDEPVHYVVHAASPASPRYYGIDPVGTIEANTTGTRQLLEFSRQEKALGFLFLSSSEIYGASQHASAETDIGAVDPMLVRSCYAEGKRLAEALCVAYHQQYGVPAVVARPFHTYGPTMRLDDGRVYADFVADIVANRSIALSSDGSARRAFCYVSDATIGFFLCLLRGEAGNAYNVGNPAETHSVLELAQMLVSSFPERGLQATAKAPHPTYLASGVNVSIPDIAKLGALGWSPRIDVKEGFRRVISHHEGH